MNLSLPLAIAPLVAATLAPLASSQTLPEVWSRHDDWVDQPASSQGTTTGNPSVDSEGNAVWFYDHASGGGFGSANPWYLEPTTPMVWDDSWFGGDGVWATADNRGALARRTSLSHWLYTQHDHHDYIPVMRWKNVTSQSFEARLTGPCLLIWNGNGGNVAQVDVEVFFGHRDGSTGALTTLFQQRIQKPTANSTYEFLPTEIDFQGLQIGPDDELFWTLRGDGESNLSQWVALADRICVIPEPLGTNYCGPAVPNSMGVPSRLAAIGSPVVADNRVTLKAIYVPPQTFGYFLTSQTQGFLANPAGSTGNLCLAGGIGRYVGPGQVQQATTSRIVSFELDLSQHPTPSQGLVQVMPGETWSFQYWHRDAGSTSNFSNGLEVTFQ